MRFLVANNHMATLGGSETFTFAMVEELVRLGHEVDVICPTSVGQDMAKNLRRVRYGSLNCFQESYDAAFLSHNTTVEMLFRLFPNFPPEKVVQTIHGAYSPLETPYHDGHRMIQFVTVSDELREIHPFARTIMNGVNLDRFKPAEKIPGSVLSMCQSDSFNQMLSEICDELGLSFKSRNKFTNPVWEIETELATAEIAIGIGRSAIEAMACGCAVLIADHRPYQGSLTDGWAGCTFEFPAKSHNYSGRRNAYPATREQMFDSLEAWADAGDWSGKAEAFGYYRQHAEQHHDIRKQVQRYLEMVGLNTEATCENPHIEARND